jgi:hypothetical protein
MVFTPFYISNAVKDVVCLNADYLLLYKYIKSIFYVVINGKN